MESTRRTFLKQAAGVAATQLLPATRLLIGAETSRSNPGWYGRPMRWAQLAFVEDDRGNYDLAFWLDYFQKIHADAACLSAGGSVAFYPTEIRDAIQLSVPSIGVHEVVALDLTS